MTWDELKQNWPAYKDQIRSQFNKLSDDDLNNIRDNVRERLTERIQNRYNCSKDEAQQKLDTFVTNLKARAKV